SAGVRTELESTLFAATGLQAANRSPVVVPESSRCPRALQRCMRRAGTARRRPCETTCRRLKHGPRRRGRVARSRRRCLLDSYCATTHDDVMAHALKLEELARRAGVSPRTVRYYIQRGLLPAPDFKGPDTAYGERHLLGLRIIRKLQVAYWPLDAIAA